MIARCGRPLRGGPPQSTILRRAVRRGGRRVFVPRPRRSRRRPLVRQQGGLTRRPAVAAFLPSSRTTRWQGTTTRPVWRRTPGDRPASRRPPMAVRPAGMIGPRRTDARSPPHALLEGGPADVVGGARRPRTPSWRRMRRRDRVARHRLGQLGARELGCEVGLERGGVVAELTRIPRARSRVPASWPNGVGATTARIRSPRRRAGRRRASSPYAGRRARRAGSIRIRLRRWRWSGHPLFNGAQAPGPAFGG